MSAVALAYPAVTAWYFWRDWFHAFRFQDLGVETWGFILPIDRFTINVLSPVRLVLAAATSVVLAGAARRMVRGKPGAQALSLVALWGLVAPQVLWHRELVQDWFGGRGLFAVTALMAAVVAVPTALMWRKGAALRGWGVLREGRARVVAGIAALGWTGLGASALYERAHWFTDSTTLTVTGLGALALSALGMVGLFKQRTWGLLAGLGATVTLGIGTSVLRDSGFARSGGVLDGVRDLLQGPIAGPLAVLAPTVVLLVLMAPFAKGVVRALSGKPDASKARVRVDVASTRVAAGPSRRQAETHAIDDPYEEAVADAEPERPARRALQLPQ